MKKNYIIYILIIIVAIIIGILFFVNNKNKENKNIQNETNIMETTTVLQPEDPKENIVTNIVATPVEDESK